MKQYATAIGKAVGIGFVIGFGTVWAAGALGKELTREAIERVKRGTRT